MSSGLWSELARVYRGPRAWLAWLSTVYIFVFFAVAIWAVCALYDADTTRDQILYGLAAVVAFVIGAACKLYLYMQMDRHALEDRLERIEKLLERP